VSLHLDIPESVAGSIRLPVPEVEPRLRTELAIALYSNTSPISNLASVGYLNLLKLGGDRARNPNAGNLEPGR